MLTGDVGNGWALYWTSDDRLVFTEEGVGWQVYTPGSEHPVLLDEAKHKKMKFIDQERFGWASSKAEPPGPAQPATQPADKPPVKDQPPTPTSKDAPR